MTADMNTKAQTETILGNPFISTPVVFEVAETDDGTHLFQTFVRSGKRAASQNKRIPGSIVSNPNIIGASASVVSLKGTVNGHASQRLLIKMQGPGAPSQAKTLDFYPVLDTSAVSDGTNLNLLVSDGLHLGTVDTGKLAKSPASGTAPLPLIVGPESAVIGHIDPTTMRELAALGIDWGGLFNVAKTVMPVVAKAGYQIYQELNQKSEQNRAPKSDVDGFFDSIMSVAKIAVPIAGSVLSAL